MRVRLFAILTLFLAVLVSIGGALKADAATETLFGSTVPPVKADTDPNAVTLGLKFTTKVAGKVTGLRFYKGTGNTGTHVGALYSQAGTRLAKASYASESASGWQSVSFSSPINVAAGATLTAATFAPRGHYAVQSPYSWPKSGTSVTGLAGTYRYGTSLGFPAQTYQASNYFVDVTFTASSTSTPTPSPTPTPTATPSPTPTATASPTPTPTATTTSPPSGGTVVLGRSFPNEKTTGVPAGKTLTSYTGPCTIQIANSVIDAKTVNCDEIRVFAKGLVIKNSVINGKVYVDYNANEGSFTITDSTVNAGNYPGTGIGDAFFTALRVNVTGGTRSINCYAECTVQDSYVHGQMNDQGGTNHESGIRVNTNSKILHNNIACDAQNFPPDAGCSAALTGYPDFDPVQGNTVQDNLISSSTGAGYCAYGGSTTGKPYSGQTRNITFKDNVFMRGSGGKCGYWGPITSFDVNAPGNVWQNNLFDNASPVAAAN